MYNTQQNRIICFKYEIFKNKKHEYTSYAEYMQ